MKVLPILLFGVVALTLTSVEAKNVVCYFTSWSIYRQNNGSFPASQVDPFLCTHLLYSFIGIVYDGSVKILDPWEAVKDQWGSGLDEIAHLLAHKNVNPNLKVLVSLGGWNDPPPTYSAVAADPAKRQKFVKSAVDFVQHYKFDGLDLDWEYPVQRGGSPNDYKNYVTLLKELKAALAPKGLLLTAAVAGGVESIKTSYDIPEVSKYLDMINIMAYDFHGSFESFVGHYAPLYASSLDKTPVQKTLNVAAGVKYWIDNGAPPQKLNLGLGTYGRGFALADPSKTELYSQTWGGSEAGPYTRTMGTIGYNEICKFLLPSYKYVWDQEQQVPHIVKGNQWIGFDDERSLKVKVEFAKSLNLGGVMVWSLDTDDFRGNCGKGKYPLLNTIKKTLGS